MDNPRNYRLVRRILFPYTGEELLSRKQGLRVILAWALVFPVSMSLCTLLIAVTSSLSSQRTTLLIVLAFLSGVFIFGILSVLIVSMNNRAVRIRQAWKARQLQQ